MKKIIILLTVALIITSCTPKQEEKKKIQPGNNSSQIGAVVENPEVDYCLEKGGTLETEERDGEEVAVCFINDGKDGIRCSLDLFYNQTCGQDTEIVSVTGISSFTECEAAGNPVMESYPRQCQTEDGIKYTEIISDGLEKPDLIKVTSMNSEDGVKSPLTIIGEARGYWFFEATFPVTLQDSDGIEIANSLAQASGDWMTEEYVPFTVTLEFDKPDTKEGLLILAKDNPSGLPENDDSLEIPVVFEIN